MTPIPTPQLIAYGFVPSGLAGGGQSQYTYGCKVISGGTGLNAISWPDGPTVPTGRMLAVLTPLQTGPGGALTFGSTIVGGTELDVQVRRSDTNAAFDGAFSFAIYLMPNQT